MGPAKITWEPVRREDTGRLKRTGWLFVLLLLLLLIRAFQVQVFKLKAVETRMPIYNQRMSLSAKRGLIYDRNMNILAMDVPGFSAALDPTVIQHPGRVAGQISEILRGDPETIRSLIDNNRNDAFVWLNKEITKKEYEDFQARHIQGVILRQEPKRAHPCPSIAGAVLGWTNAGHQGVSGIEQSQDAVLRGEDGWEILQKDGKDRNYASADCPSVQPKNGRNVVLTLDQTSQTIVEEELERGVSTFRAKAGHAVLMDPGSGEILSMASVMDKHEGQTNFESEFLSSNLAVQAEFEPGSTLKVVAAAAALEEGIFNPGSMIHCENGSYRLAGHVIHDHDKRYNYLSLSQVIEYSSNIGVAKIAKRLGKRTLFRYLQNFGFGTPTGIELAGEAPGTIWPLYKWDDFSTATIAFGQGISVNTLQLACMVSAIANGGNLKKPQLLQSIVDEEGNPIRKFGSETIRRVVSERTALQMREILEKTVKQGNAGEAGVAGIRVAGKTGTAQKSISGFAGYVPGTYISSFAGFWPSDAARYVLVVVLEEPKGLYYAAQSCAPIFSNIVKRMIGLPSSPIFPQDQPKENEQEIKFAFSNYQIRNETERPPVRTEDPVRMDPSRVPRLTGLSLREALQKLAECGMEARPEGSGVVREQMPKAGEPLTSGTVCRLICR